MQMQSIKIEAEKREKRYRETAEQLREAGEVKGAIEYDRLADKMKGIYE